MKKVPMSANRFHAHTLDSQQNTSTTLHCIDCQRPLTDPWCIYQTVIDGEVIRPLCAVCHDRRKSP